MSNDVAQSESGCSRVSVIATTTVLLVIVCVGLPAISHLRESARRQQSKRQLMSLGLAIYNYYDTFSRFPPGGVFNEEGVAYHGWTTSVAPYFDASPWYNMVSFNIPWDDPRQVALFRDWSTHESRHWCNPSVSPVYRADGLVFNHYAGNQNVFYRNSSVDRFRYGLHNGQILVADALGNHLPVGIPYPWRDVTLGLMTDENGFGCRPRKMTQCLMVDGSVREIAGVVDGTVATAMAGSPDHFPKPDQVARPRDYPLIDISRIWQFELEVEDNQWKDYRVRWIPPPGHEGERR